MSFQKLTIFYFSGTGNSKNVAQWMSALASKHNIECSIHSIASIERNSLAPLSAGSLIVFVSPVHGFNYPPVMLNLLPASPKGKIR